MLATQMDYYAARSLVRNSGDSSTGASVCVLLSLRNIQKL